MKYIFVFLTCIGASSLRSATILLKTQDSIINPLIFSNNFGKKIYGRSALFASGQRKFLIGVFDSNNNDTLDKLDIVAISEQKNNKTTLFTSADKMNSNYFGKLKFIIIENNKYEVSIDAFDKVIIGKTQSTADIKEFNFIDCLVNIFQYKSILIDSTSRKIDSIELTKFIGKPTIIYYTISHCAPCEKLKPLISEILSSKKINLIIVSNNIDNSSKDFRTYKNRYYFDGMMDRSKVRSYGFPQVVVFDKNGNFVESDNGGKREDLLKKYAFSN